MVLATRSRCSASHLRTVLSSTSIVNGLMKMALSLLIPACLALSLLAAGILVEGQLPGFASVQTFRLLYPNTNNYECVGTSVTSAVQPLDVLAPDEQTILIRPATYGTSTPREVFQFYLYEQGSLDSDLDQDVVQGMNSQTNKCWTSGPFGTELEQVPCATDRSTIGSADTRRQLFELSEQQASVSCGSGNGVYQLISTFDNEEGIRLVLTPSLDTSLDLADLRWLPALPTSDFFITDKTLVA